MQNKDRDNTGKFIKGNKAGRGRPIGSRVDELRRTLVLSVTTDDISEIARALIGQAKNGDIGAVKLLFDRVLGNPIALDILERKGGLDSIEKMEMKVEREDRLSKNPFDFDSF